MPYTDCHIVAYSKYVSKAASSCVPAKRFKDWFTETYGKEPTVYVGLNHAKHEAQLNQDKKKALEYMYQLNA